MGYGTRRFSCDSLRITNNSRFPVPVTKYQHSAGAPSLHPRLTHFLSWRCPSPSPAHRPRQRPPQHASPPAPTRAPGCLPNFLPTRNAPAPTRTVHPPKPCKRLISPALLPRPTASHAGGSEPQPPLATSQARLFSLISLPTSLSTSRIAARCTDIPARTSAGTEGVTEVDMEEEDTGTGATRRPLDPRRRGDIRRSISSRPRATSSRPRTSRRRLTSTATACPSTAVCPSVHYLLTSLPSLLEHPHQAPTNTSQTTTPAPLPAPRPHPRPATNTSATAPRTTTPSSTRPVTAGARPSSSA